MPLLTSAWRVVGVWWPHAADIGLNVDIAMPGSVQLQARVNWPAHGG